MPELRQRRDMLAADLGAMAPPPKVVELHPAAVKRYLASVEELAMTLSGRVVEGNEEAAAALRDLVAAVVIHPHEGEEPEIEVTGRLAKLTGADLFPQQRIP